MPFCRRGKAAARKQRRAQVLLKADAAAESSGPTDAEVAEALDVSSITVHRTRKAYVEEGLSAAFEGKPNAGHPRRKLDGAKEAVLIATACSPPPAGRTRWTLRILADKLVELQVVDAIGKDCVADALKNEVKPWLKQHWVLPKADDPDLVGAMEDVLDVYQRPRDEKRPLLCLDEAQAVGGGCDAGRADAAGSTAASRL